MPENTPNNGDTEPVKIEFIEFHQPPLKDGDYFVTVKQVIQIADDSPKTFESSSRFNVSGERFSFSPALIYSVFPPEGSLGQHFNVLPHVILNRSTLPWERMADKNHKNVPWLALLLFDADEAITPTIMKLGELKNESVNNIKWTGIDDMETGQHEDDKVVVIDVEKELLDKIMPSAKDLSWLSHVRQGKDAAGALTGDELAIIIGNRLPQMGGICTAHLVSVEDRYKDGSFFYQGAESSDLIRLVSLKSWSFACLNEKQDFKGLLENLDPYTGNLDRKRSVLRLPPQKNTPAEAEKYLSLGSVPLPHFMRQGSKTVSWYHGPLIPGQNTNGRLASPVRAADELLRYNPSNGMFDVSYAAAWELGRLLALQSKKLSVSLYHWKRANVQRQKQGEQRLLHSHLHEPGQTAPGIEMPDDISTWFDGLSLLQGVPFNYLVPDEQMLPKESIRFFRLDPLWVDCLVDGAFSIGRVTSSDHAQDQKFDKSLGNSSEDVSGCLLRSEVVSGWTDLLVDAYDESDHTKGGKRLDLLRKERLSANILLCLFGGGEMKRVEVHQKPESLHFGFNKPDVAPSVSTLSKTFRNNDGTEPDDAKPFELNKHPDVWMDAPRRSIDIGKLADKIKSTLSEDTFTSAQFALQMIEGVEKVIFKIQ